MKSMRSTDIFAQPVFYKKRTLLGSTSPAAIVMTLSPDLLAVTFILREGKETKEAKLQRNKAIKSTGETNQDVKEVKKLKSWAKKR